MRQTIHIFLKDARRSWPYIAVVFAINAILAVLTPQWKPSYDAATRTLNNTVDFLQFLLPVAWWLAVAHVVQGEELVGDRQFWVTRPYSWKSLCAAKVLFCVAFLAAPFLVCDCIILSADGFSPAAVIGGLLWRQYFLACMLMLPPFVLATLTRGMRQFVLTCFAVAAVFVVLMALAPFRQSDTLGAAIARIHPDSRSWFEQWGAAVLYGGGGLALLLWQYARRRTAAVRAIVIALCALLLVSSVWPPGAVAEATAARPPVPPAEYPEIAVVFAPGHGRLNRAGSVAGEGESGEIQVDIPVELTGRNRDLLRYQLAAVAIAPEGSGAWNSALNWWLFTDRDGGDWIDLSLHGRDFQRLNRGPVELRAVFGVTVFERQSVTRVRPGGEWTKIPGFGAVAIPENSWFPAVWWRAPLLPPSERVVYTIRGPDSAVLGHGEWPGIYPHAADVLHISPVVFLAAPVQTSGSNLPGGFRFPRDAQAEFTVERPLALVRRDLLIPSLRLADYVAGNSR